jgi:hypothetical protein
MTNTQEFEIIHLSKKVKKTAGCRQIYQDSLDMNPTTSCLPKKALHHLPETSKTALPCMISRA